MSKTKRLAAQPHKLDQPEQPPSDYTLIVMDWMNCSLLTAMRTAAQVPFNLPEWGEHVEARVLKFIHSCDASEPIVVKVYRDSSQSHCSRFEFLLFDPLFSSEFILGIVRGAILQKRHVSIAALTKGLRLIAN